MPVRKIPKNYRNVTGRAPHEKAMGSASFESLLERDFLLLLEFSNEVKRFEVQPVTIRWQDDTGARRTYTPDVLVHYHASTGLKTTLFEVKYRKDLNRDWVDLREKFKAAIRYAKEHGWRFKLVSEIEIRTPYLENIRFLSPFVKNPPAAFPEVEQYMDLLSREIRRSGESTPQNLIRDVFNSEWQQAKLLPVLWYLVGSGQIGADLTRPINMKTPIWSIP